MKYNFKSFRHGQSARLAIIVITLLTGCQSTVIENDQTTPANGSSTLILNETSLENGTYTLEQTDWEAFTLFDGTYSLPNPPSEWGEVLVNYYGSAFGELNADGVEDAAVILTVNTGGTGTFLYLFAVLSQPDGSFFTTPPIYLGDRTVINMLAISENQINVEGIQNGPNDPFCCPSQQFTADYGPSENQLVLIQQTILPSP